MTRIAGAVGSAATIAVFVIVPFVYSELGLPWAGGFVLGVVLFAWGLSKLLRRDEGEQEGARSAEGLEQDPFGERRSSNQPAWLAVLGGVVILAFVAGAFATRGEGDIGRIRDANESWRSGAGTDIDPELTAAIHSNDLRVGDCFTSPDLAAGRVVEDVRVVLCNGEWQYIVLDSFEMQRDGAYPSGAFFDDEALRCDSWMTLFLTPDQENWDTGQRTMDCLLVPEAFFSPTVGDCFAFAANELLLIESRSEVPCLAAHITEAFAVIQHAASVFPGTMTIDEFANEACMDEFEDYVGLPYEESEMFFFFFAPSRGTWELLGRREIDCYLYVPDAEGEFSIITGSLRNARR